MNLNKTMGDLLNVFRTADPRTMKSLQDDLADTVPIFKSSNTPNLNADRTANTGMNAEFQQSLMRFQGDVGKPADMAGYDASNLNSHTDESTSKALAALAGAYQDIADKFNGFREETQKAFVSVADTLAMLGGLGKADVDEEEEEAEDGERQDASEKAMSVAVLMNRINKSVGGQSRSKTRTKLRTPPTMIKASQAAAALEADGSNLTQQDHADFLVLRQRMQRPGFDPKIHLESISLPARQALGF